MRKQLIAALTATVMAFSISSCMAGPHQLRRSVDDWDAKMYANSPILDGVLWVIPFWPLCTWGSYIGDFFIGDAYQFWFKDVWAGKGAGFDHAKIESAGKVGSLLNDNASWLKVDK
jgi:hypothetical protein